MGATAVLVYGAWMLTRDSLQHRLASLRRQVGLVFARGLEPTPDILVFHQLVKKMASLRFNSTSGSQAAPSEPAWGTEGGRMRGRRVCDGRWVENKRRRWRACRPLQPTARNPGS